MSPDTMVAPAAHDDTLESLRPGRRAAGQDPAKRKQIIDGARRIFINMGFDAASMNDITREAGVSKGTIYVYFANKEELFEALIEDERQTIFANLYDALEGDGDVRETLIRYGIALARKITSPTVLKAQRTVISICERMPEIGVRFYERGPKRGHDKLAVFLTRAVEKGLLDIPDIDLAAYQLGDLSMSRIFRQCLFGYRSTTPSEEEIGEVVTAGVDVFLKAYGPEKTNR
ncbi:TetR/AcrR family transcriptional regulator [Mesorhizobium sp. IMUNJ 23232]|uniref:TetR/AcrR family transcriptional regulator n=1 Tax=Mesorhizobium sp. IMUNJ 23232 TaxID=3376064 RepID=UPI0037BC2E3F